MLRGNQDVLMMDIVCKGYSLRQLQYPPHHAGTKEIARRMFSMLVVQGVEYGNRRLRFLHIIGGLPLPDEIFMLRPP